MQRDSGERSRHHVVENGGFVDQPAVPDPHPTNGEAREGADEEREHHRSYADIEAVAELLPKILKIPVALGHYDPEAFERRFRWPDVVGEHVTMRLERHDHDVVDRHERPDQDRDADRQRRHLGQVSPQPVVRAPPPGAPLGGHNATSTLPTFGVRTMSRAITY